MVRTSAPSANAARYKQPETATSAAQAVSDEHGIRVVAVAGLDDLLEFARESAELVDQRAALLAYRARHGCA